VGLIGIAAVSAAFHRDVETALARVGTLIRQAREGGAQLVVLPANALGGYIVDLAHLDPGALPPPLTPDHPALRRLTALARDTVVCVGYCEGAEEKRYNAAVCVSGDGVLGRHRKVHLPVGEGAVYTAGDTFAAFDTPVGRVGMLIDYDKTFPESARTLALDGAQVIACLSAWRTSFTNRAPSMADDLQSRRFELYDRARAAENQVVLASSNQIGSPRGGLRFLGQAKVVNTDGEIVARTWAKAGIALAVLDVDSEIARARRVQHHLDERRPDSYAKLL
jgi:predicted amidohydrolase